MYKARKGSAKAAGECFKRNTGYAVLSEKGAEIDCAHDAHV